MKINPESLNFSQSLQKTHAMSRNAPSEEMMAWLLRDILKNECEGEEARDNDDRTWLPLAYMEDNSWIW